MARRRGIITIVDGAHAMGHFPYKLRDLEMDYYGVSLHKWLLAPLGTGLLYVRKDRIASTWPLQAAPERSDKDIRKFEEIGTSPAATKAAINEAIAFQQAIGGWLVTTDCSQQFQRGSDHTKDRAWSCSACPMALDRSYCADDLCLLRTGRSDRFQPGDTQAFAFLITEQITLGMQLLPYMAFGEKPRA